MASQFTSLNDLIDYCLNHSVAEEKIDGRAFHRINLSTWSDEWYGVQHQLSFEMVDGGYIEIVEDSWPTLGFSFDKKEV